MKIREFHYEDIEELNEESAKKFKQKYDTWFHPVIKYNTEEGIQIDTIRKDFLSICTEEFLTLLSVHGDRKVLCYIDSCYERILIDFRDGWDYDLDVLSNEMLHAIVNHVDAATWGVVCFYYDCECACLGIKYTSK